VAYTPKAKFSLGKVASKYLILEMLAYAGGVSKYILWEGNRSYRTLLSENLRFIGFNLQRLPIVEFPPRGEIIIPSTCDYQRFRYRVTLDNIENIDKWLDFCKLKSRPNQDPPIVVIDLEGLASTLKKNN
jgi:hypothetical protein